MGTLDVLRPLAVTRKFQEGDDSVVGYRFDGRECRHGNFRNVLGWAPPLMLLFMSGVITMRWKD